MEQHGNSTDSPYLHATLVDAPVGLILSRAGARRNAMTVSFFSEVAHHPTSLWVSVEPDCFTHSLLAETGEFSFITLHERQANIAFACGTATGRVQDKCAGLDIYESPLGFLFFRDALASVACRIRRSVPLGGHTLFIADMLAGDVNTRRSTLRQLLLSDLRAAR